VPGVKAVVEQFPSVIRQMDHVYQSLKNQVSGGYWNVAGRIKIYLYPICDLICILNQKPRWRTARYGKVVMVFAYINL
jgi:hypothetical protein